MRNYKEDLWCSLVSLCEALSIFSILVSKRNPNPDDGLSNPQQAAITVTAFFCSISLPISLIPARLHNEKIKYGFALTSGLLKPLAFMGFSNLFSQCIESVKGDCEYDPVNSNSLLPFAASTRAFETFMLTCLAFSPIFAMAIYCCVKRNQQAQAAQAPAADLEAAQLGR